MQLLRAGGTGWLESRQGHIQQLRTWRAWPVPIESRGDSLPAPTSGRAALPETNLMSWKCAVSFAVGVALLAPGGLSAQEELGKKGRPKVQIELATYKDSPSFEIEFESVIPRSTVKQVAEALEEALGQYIQVFKFKPKEKLKVRFFDNPNTYEQEGGKPSTAGFFSPGTECLYLQQMPFYQLIPVAYHEALHQYLHFYVGKGVEIPTWFNEGMATYYEGIKKSKETKKLDYKLIDNRKLKLVQEKITTRTAIPLEKLIDAPYDAFHDKADPQKETLHYHQSFSVIYFLMQAKMGKPVLQFTEELRKSKNPKTAEEKLFGKDRKNLKTLEAQWKAYVAQVKIDEQTR